MSLIQNELLLSLMQMGAIPRCRRAYVEEMLDMNEEVGAGIDVCFVGAGCSEEALVLAAMGVSVTVVDLSESMLDEFRVRLEVLGDEARSRVTVVHGDVRDIEGDYDWVVAHFFLNVFDEAEMREMVGVLVRLCDVGGSVVVGDFYGGGEDDGFFSGVKNLLRLWYWSVALFVFCLFVRNARHPIYDYDDEFLGLGWDVFEVKRFGLLWVDFYQSVWYKRL